MVDECLISENLLCRLKKNREYNEKKLENEINAYIPYEIPIA